MTDLLSDEHYETARGKLTIKNPAAGVIHSEAQGHGDTSLAERISDFVARAMEQHADGALVFHNWYALEGYDSDARRLLVESGKRHREHTEALHILVRSNVVVMGMSVASMFLTNLHPHKDPAEFDAALAAAIRTRKSA